MAGHYVSLGAEKMEAFFLEKGFKRSVQGKEVVFIRQHNNNKNLYVKVYSSLTDGEKAVRECGGDAIRVCSVFNNRIRSYGIRKFPRIYRVGSEEKVYERLLERMRAAYSSLNDAIKEHRLNR